MTGLPRFTRRFFGGPESVTAIGGGGLGGKAAGLRAAQETLRERPASLRFDALEIDVPTLAVVATDAFDLFLAQNSLGDVIAEAPPDHVVAHAFQRGDLPAPLLGDLWALVQEVRAPLAVRSSSLLEDALAHPFAGVYATKMTPNNQFDPETRFRRLTEAIKFVYASTFFRNAVAYREAIGQPAGAEKMAVILQEIVGRRRGPRFYPDVSGVARSLNYYPTGPARAEDGVVDLALGLGKTIVDGGRAWTYSPRHPRAPAPFASAAAVLRETQTEFWAVNMGAPPAFDPVAETEYLVHGTLAEAEADGALRELASTYDPARDRVVTGTGASGPRVLDFAPLRESGDLPWNEALAGLLALFESSLGAPVEIELAACFEPERARLGFLQVRPMQSMGEGVSVGEGDLTDPRALIAAERVMGNGVVDDVRDVVFVRREGFELSRSRAIASELDGLNRKLVAAGRRYLLIGFGRWGSSDPWLGIPVEWAQIAGARAIVEAALPGVHVEPSQGAHFFHNMLSFGVAYLTVSGRGDSRIDWDALAALPRVEETQALVHARVPRPFEIRVDGRAGRGIVKLKQEPA